MVKYYWVEWKFSCFYFIRLYSVIGGWIVIYIGNVFLQLLSVEHTSLTQIKFEK